MTEFTEHRIQVDLACDFSSLALLKELVRMSHDFPRISGIKLGFELGLSEGLAAAVDIIKSESNLRVTYDHQKGATDTPSKGKRFANSLAAAHVDAAILFPLTGPATQMAWIQACRDVDVTVLIGADMTHKQFLVSDGGYIADNAPERIYRLAAEIGVCDFVFPGTKPDAAALYAEIVSQTLSKPFTAYVPGFGKQGASIAEIDAVLSPGSWRAIIGEEIYGVEDPDERRRVTTAFIETISLAEV